MEFHNFSVIKLKKYLVVSQWIFMPWHFNEESIFFFAFYESLLTFSMKTSTVWWANLDCRELHIFILWVMNSALMKRPFHKRMIKWCWRDGFFIILSIKFGDNLDIIDISICRSIRWMIFLDRKLFFKCKVILFTFDINHLFKFKQNQLLLVSIESKLFEDAKDFLLFILDGDLVIY